MYENRNHGCGEGRREAIRDLVEGIADIRQGLKCLCKALADLRCRKDHCAEKNLIKGIECVECGLKKAIQACQAICD